MELLNLECSTSNLKTKEYREQEWKKSCLTRGHDVPINSQNEHEKKWSVRRIYISTLRTGKVYTTYLILNQKPLDCLQPRSVTTNSKQRRIILSLFLWSDTGARSDKVVLTCASLRVRTSDVESVKLNQRSATKQYFTKQWFYKKGFIMQYSRLQNSSFNLVFFSRVEWPPNKKLKLSGNDYNEPQHFHLISCSICPADAVCCGILSPAPKAFPATKQLVQRLPVMQQKKHTNVMVIITKCVRHTRETIM